MRFVALCLLLLSCYSSFSQCKTFTIGSSGDTLNCVDKAGMKQGKWIIRNEPIRVTPGSIEEGTFKDDRKHGEWKKYSLMGDLVSIENYRYGYKDGICQYFTIAGLEREESWKAITPQDAYDTIAVMDVYDDTKVQNVRIKRDGESYEHGTWKYYQPGGILLRVEKYNMGKLGEEPDEKVFNEPVDSTGLGKKDLKKMKPKEVIQFEKKYSKKRVKVRDGRTGM